MQNIYMGFGLVLLFILFSLPMTKINVRALPQKAYAMLTKKIKQNKKMMKLSVKKIAKETREVKLTSHLIYADQVTKVKPSFSSLEYNSGNLQGWKCIQI